MYGSEGLNAVITRSSINHFIHKSVTVAAPLHQAAISTQQYACTSSICRKTLNMRYAFSNMRSDEICDCIQNDAVICVQTNRKNTLRIRHIMTKTNHLNNNNNA